MWQIHVWILDSSPFAISNRWLPAGGEVYIYIYCPYCSGEIYNWQELDVGQSFRSDGDALLSEYQSLLVPGEAPWSNEGFQACQVEWDARKTLEDNDCNFNIYIYICNFAACSCSCLIYSTYWFVDVFQSLHCRPYTSCIQGLRRVFRSDHPPELMCQSWNCMFRHAQHCAFPTCSEDYATRCVHKWRSPKSASLNATMWWLMFARLEQGIEPHGITILHQSCSGTPQVRGSLNAGPANIDRFWGT